MARELLRMNEKRFLFYFNILAVKREAPSSFFVSVSFSVSLLLVSNDQRPIILALQSLRFILVESSSTIYISLSFRSSFMHFRVYRIFLSLANCFSRLTNPYDILFPKWHVRRIKYDIQYRTNGDSLYLRGFELNIIFCGFHGRKGNASKLILLSSMKNPIEPTATSSIKISYVSNLNYRCANIFNG